DRRVRRRPRGDRVPHAVPADAVVPAVRHLPRAARRRAARRALVRDPRGELMPRTVEHIAAFRDRIVTPDAVYGTVLFAVVIAAASDGDLDHPGEPLELLVTAVLTLAVFCIAHIYARTIANHGVRRGEDVPLGTALRRAVLASLGMLWAAVPSAIVLVLGALHVVPDADDWALWVA